jgi:ABC-2 type transport system permease protein
MKKYLTVFAISWQNEFTYRLNFILWRVRNVLRILMTYFLWLGIFSTPRGIMGLTREQMLTYVLLVLFVQAITLSAPSGEAIGGEIGSGDLSNFLVKPIGYLKYWLTRDLASKLLNILFSFLEITLLWIFLHPTIVFPNNPLVILSFIASLGLGILIYFFLETSTRFIAFWTPEYTWGLSFLTLVFIETLAGTIFPINLLPDAAKFFIDLTPFPYLVYYPISILIGTTTGLNIIKTFIIMCIWVLLLFKLNRFLWTRGLKIYASEGR